jgi:hypothetical protein
MAPSITEFEAKVKLDPKLFASMLWSDLQGIPLPFAIKQPLTYADFLSHQPADLEDSDSDTEENTTLFYLHKLTTHLLPSFSEDKKHTNLPTHLWLGLTNKLLTTLHYGLFKSFVGGPTLDEALTYRTETHEAMKEFSKGIMALSHFFTNSVNGEAAKWQQCLCCLQVANVQVTHNY